MDVNIGESHPRPNFCPLSVLSKLHRYRISLLAVFADELFELSGSNGLEVCCPGFGSAPESDFDVYGVADPATITNIMHVLHFAPVRWNNFLTAYVTQERRYGQAVMPCEIMVDVAEKLEIPPPVLKSYLRSRFSQNSSRKDFVTQFISAYKECWVKVLGHSWDDCSSNDDSSDDDDATLIGSGSEDTSDEYDSSEDELLDMATPDVSSDEDTSDDDDSGKDTRDKSSDEGTSDDEDSDEDSSDDESSDGGPSDSELFDKEAFGESVREEVGATHSDRAQNMVWVYRPKTSNICEVPPAVIYLLEIVSRRTKAKTAKIALAAAKTAWNHEGWPEELLEDYIRNRASSNSASIRIDHIFENRKRPKQSNGAYPGKTPRGQRADEDEEFKILQGTLLDSGSKIQLMLVSDRKKSVLHTVLGFYATHVMCSIGGTQGVHLYFPSASASSSAETRKSYEVDVSAMAWKQGGAPAAKQKYKDRGWTFVPLNNEFRTRNGGDDEVKKTNYEYIYRSALHKGQILPEWWEDYFKSRKLALSKSSWAEKDRRIVNVYSGDALISRDHSLLDWVQKNLAGHPDVIPKDEWDKREDNRWIELDLWFGGAHALARGLHVRTKYGSKI
jgi:hypothetical protein